MSKKSTYLLGILLTIIIGSLLYRSYCCNCSTKVESNTANALPQSIFELKGNGIDYHCNGNFNFLESDFKAIMPITDCANLGINKLKPVLDKGGQKLTITGYALSTEINNSVYENLGLARAKNVKNYFVSKGIPSNVIEIRGEIKEVLSQKDKTIYGPVAYTLTEIAANTPAEDWKTLKEKINANPLILYFETGQAHIDLTVEDRKKVTDITRYLDYVENAKIDVVGYTDNVGTKESNVKLGQERADFAKAYLVSNGIDAEKINSVSKGQEEPIADNATPEGKAKNRRTIVKIN